MRDAYRRPPEKIGQTCDRTNGGTAPRRLDDTQLRTLDERLTYLRDLDARREAILKSIEGQGKLTPTPQVGRPLTADDDRSGSPAMVVALGATFWESRFGSDPRVVGTVLRINDRPFTIVGVAPREFVNSEPGYAAYPMLPLGTLPLTKPSAPPSR